MSRKVYINLCVKLATAKIIPNRGTLTLDATCAPANIRYPQDISLLVMLDDAIPAGAKLY